MIWPGAICGAGRLAEGCAEAACCGWDRAADTFCTGVAPATVPRLPLVMLAENAEREPEEIMR